MVKGSEVGKPPLLAESSIRTELHFVHLLQAKKQLRDKLQRGHGTRCNVPATCLATPLQHKLQSCRARFYFSQRLQIFFETIPSCSPKLRRITFLMQLALDSFFSSELKHRRILKFIFKAYLCH